MERTKFFGRISKLDGNNILDGFNYIAYFEIGKFNEIIKKMHDIDIICCPVLYFLTG